MQRSTLARSPSSRPRALPSLLVIAASLALGVLTHGPTPTMAQTSPRATRATTAASASRPFEAELSEQQAEVVRAGRSPRAIVPLLQLWRAYPSVPPERIRATLEALSRERRLSPAVRMYASQLAARAALRDGDAAGSRQRFEALGYIRDFRLVGPFDNEGKQGFAREYEPERLRMAPYDLEARYEGRERPVGWRSYPDIGHFGYISFDAIERPNTNVCGYAETFVTSPRAQALSLWLGGGGAIAAWWNGVEVLRDAQYRYPDPDRAVAMVGAHQGPNRLLVKVCVADSTWGFFARVGGPNGEPTTGLTFSSEADVAAVLSGHGVSRLPAAPMAPLAALEAAASGEHPSAEALQDLARFLSLTGSDDPAEQRAKQLAERAADAGPSVERWLFAADLATSRADAGRFIDRAAQLRPDSPEVLLARARLTMSGPNPDDALQLLDRVPATGTAGLRAAQLRAEVLQSLALPDTARGTIERAAERAPGAPGWIAARAHAASEADRRDEAMTLFQQALDARYDDQSLREVMIADAIARDDVPAAVREIERYRALSNDSVARLLRVASWYEALNRDGDAMANYRAAIELTPEEADAHVALGRALLRAGQDDLAMASLEEAQRLRPQDAETRELLEHLSPQQRPDEAYAASAEELLARVSEERGFPYRVLEDLTVNTVFDSGLGSNFRQFAAQVVDAEGGRALRSFPITFDPDVQRVTIRAARVYREGRQLEAASTYEQSLGEPWYRIYYDTRARVVVFPELRPGDVVEVRYRIDDVAERNLFHDYYGDMHFFQGGAPIARIDYVLITPASRSFYFNTPRMASLHHEVEERGTHRIHRYFAENVLALQSEDGMPGATETRPYLHVSTYADWQGVGRWWWGLVHDQLYADDSLRRTVRELVQGAPDTRTKVQRIYRWVIDHTRYVGLEFGIHGFLPYRVPQIVERGFGDCKDKAALLYTMLTEAGIDARMVLVRTRRNGALTDLPASLAAFDHAIAYVPELDLYLDGTAEFSGSTEFPQMDQGVTVLLVGPNDVELRRSPVMTPEHNARERRIAIELAADGSARVQADETIRGHEAPGWRSRYQAEATRRDRFEESMRRTFSGIEVQSVQMTGLTNYEEPVTASYRASVPQLAVRDADGLRVPVTVLGDLVRGLARTERREHALDLGATSRYVEHRTIRLPAGHRLDATPEGGRIESPFGVFEMTLAATATEVTIDTSLTLSRDRIEASEYPAFRAFVQRADTMLRQRLSVARGAAGARGVTP